jgi:alpha-2-macroglobulin
VRRSYKPVDSPSDVVQLPDGRWKVKLGARVLVQLETINTTSRHAVALVDPLPAGFEAVNTRLATAERAVIDLDSDRWDYENMRDNRSEVFSMQLAEGTHRFSYTARATTPGTFIAAPAKAEEMYSPETFGRSSGTTVVVE